MIIAAYGRTEKCHDLIADELVEGAVAVKNCPRSKLVETIESRRHVRGMELFGERGKAADVGEQDRDIERLPARRSQLVSKRAEVVIFPRRADL